MARHPRYLPSEATVEVMCRTLHSKYLLTPSPEVNRIVVGVLARAQERFEVEVHFYSFLSTHYHLLVTPKDQKHLSGFMCYLNSNVARKIGRLHNWTEKFWGKRYSAIMVDDCEETQHRRLRYLLEQGCKEGLVSSPLEWPGATALATLVAGRDAVEGYWTDLTAIYHARKALEQLGPRENGKKRKLRERDFSTLHTLKLTPIPAWRGYSPEAIANELLAMVGVIVDETAALHKANQSKPLGVKAILRQRPTDEAASPSRRPAPRIHAKDQRARKRFWANFGEFLSFYNGAAEKLRRGLAHVKFPQGCFPPGMPFVEHCSSPTS